MSESKWVLFCLQLSFVYSLNERRDLGGAGGVSSALIGLAD